MSAALLFLEKIGIKTKTQAVIRNTAKNILKSLLFFILSFLICNFGKLFGAGIGWLEASSEIKSLAVDNFFKIFLFSGNKNCIFLFIVEDYKKRGKYRISA